MSKRVLIILGHPSTDSFCGAIATCYFEAATQAGREVRIVQLGALNFDPVLHEGYNQIQTLEQDLLDAQADIMWAEHLVFVFPLWWGGVPALLKGFIDRTFLPGFAFKYRQGKVFPDKLLKGRTAHLLVAMDTAPWYYKWVYWMPGASSNAQAHFGVLRHKTADHLDVRPSVNLDHNSTAKVAATGHDACPSLMLRRPTPLLRTFHVHRQSGPIVRHDHKKHSSL